MPEWMIPVRIAATFMIWGILPLQIFSIVWSWLQHRQWRAGEALRMERWQRDMDDAAKFREEAYHLRAQAEVALAQARRQMMIRPVEVEPLENPAAFAGRV
jgi:hypothetical protein